VLDSLAVAGMLAGSLVAPAIVAAVGLRWTLVLAGGTLLAFTAAAIPRLRGLDRRAEATRRELAPKVGLLDGLRVFEGASRQALECLAAAMEERAVPAGAVVVAEGEEADAFYLVRSGILAVLSAGERGGPPARVNTLGPGDYFGEVAILRDSPRIATVKAKTPTTLLAMDRDSLRSLVAGSLGTTEEFDRVIRERMTAAGQTAQ
jgi:CRP-like cAMP-binding protein